MSSVTSSEQVAHSLRPVVVAVVAAKILIAGFLCASLAGFVPAPAVAEQATSVYLAATPSTE